MLPQPPGVSIEPPSGVPSASVGSSAPSVRLSYRLLVHLATQGRLAPGEVATFAFTQAGMAQALGTTQSTLSNVLGRLVRAGVLTSELGHVPGQTRRLRVYRLTTLGETIAREVVLRTRPGS
jgi:DNA-binding MarR family transcriptional regulator